MSALSSTSLSSIDPSLLGASTPAINQALLPASIRNGTPAAKQAYNEALGFEQILVNELTQEMAATVTSPDDSSSDDGLGGDDSSDDSSSTDATSGLLGSDPSMSMYAQMLPDALTSSLMSSGGTGMALQIAQALDPSIMTTAPPATTTTPTSTPSSGTTIPSSGGASPSPGSAQ